MTEIRLLIVLCVILLFWGFVMAAWMAFTGSPVLAVALVTVLIPMSLAAWIRAKQDWNVK